MMVVVDTNVAVVANGRSEQASADCERMCIQRIQRITKRTDKLVLDDQWRIIREYQNHLRPEGQRGVGDAFLMWVLTNRKNPKRCQLVTITQVGDNETDFREFPSDPALQGFDPADRKFVAVVLAHSQHPPILQAVDSKWWDVKEPLERNSVKVEFLCPHDIQRFQTSQGKRQRMTRRRT
jgi:hypothetical protein